MQAILILFISLTTSIGFSAGREQNFSAFVAKELVKTAQSAQRIQFIGQKGVKLNGYYFGNGKEKQAIVIAPGWSEPAQLYFELIYDLLNYNYAIYILDHRGQGESERLINCECSHLDSYQYYIDDFSTFIETKILHKNYERLYLLGHSMGGAIAALAAQRIPTKITKLVLTTPLFQANTQGLPDWLARAAIKSLVVLGYGERRKPFDTDRPFIFSNNRWTQSEARWNQAKKISDNLGVPKILYFTNGWLNEIFAMTQKIQEGQKNLFVIPTLVLQAETDFFVDNKMQNEICAVSQKCQLVKIAQSWHSVLQDEDTVREVALKEILKFIND